MIKYCIAASQQRERRSIGAPSFTKNLIKTQVSGTTANQFLKSMSPERQSGYRNFDYMKNQNVRIQNRPCCYGHNMTRQATHLYFLCPCILES
ncbi:unnamed protein product [Allacma fusca]|uniref:Uncharacterized protein n=1 Tax=Allacma fusca TaxID=39272 RepID=A0A8J2P5M2_9HEXA|nr:unnamed protein product [Allacma fusca]